MHSVIATGGCDGNIHLSWLHESFEGGDDGGDRCISHQVEKKIISISTDPEGKSLIKTFDPTNVKKTDIVSLHPLASAVRSVVWCKSKNWPGLLATGTGSKTVHLVSTDRYCLLYSSL